MHLPFSLAGAPGHVDVVVAVNTDPLALGCRPAARGFPYCSASVNHPARGYTAALGWIQLVRSTDGASGGASFEMDPFEPLGSTTHPFAFFGFLPTLFDAPSREPIGDMAWTAHSFLCRLGERTQHTRALLGFSWGFLIRHHTITPHGPAVLDPADWNEHLTMLAHQHPGWSFTPGFEDA
jgi:hypothetical protein